MKSICEAVIEGIERVKAGEVSADDLVYLELPAVMRAKQDGYDPTARRPYALWRQCEDGGDFSAEEFVRLAEDVLMGKS